MTSPVCSPRMNSLPPRTAAQRLRTFCLIYPSLAPPSPPPLLPPLSCITTPVEDQAKGEEWNQWQGSPRRLFSPGCSHRTTPPSAARPASHWTSLSAYSQDGEWGIRKCYYCDPLLEVDTDYVSYLVSIKKAHLN